MDQEEEEEEATVREGWLKGTTFAKEGSVSEECWNMFEGTKEKQIQMQRLKTWWDDAKKNNRGN